MFSAKPLMGFHSQALTLQGKFEFHKSLKVIRYTVVLAKVARPTHMWWRAWPSHS